MDLGLGGLGLGVGVAEETCGMMPSSRKIGPRIMPPPTPSMPAAMAPTATIIG